MEVVKCKAFEESNIMDVDLSIVDNVDGQGQRHRLNKQNTRNKVKKLTLTLTQLTEKKLF